MFVMPLSLPQVLKWQLEHNGETKSIHWMNEWVNECMNEYKQHMWKLSSSTTTNRRIQLAWKLLILLRYTIKNKYTSNTYKINHAKEIEEKAQQFSLSKNSVTF